MVNKEELQQVAVEIDNVLDHNKVSSMDGIKILTLLASNMVSDLKQKGVPIDMKIEFLDTSKEFKA